MPDTKVALVVVEVMPISLRASHEAAGNRGTYPHNGAKRFIMPRPVATLECDGDWERIIRPASSMDKAVYPIALSVEHAL